MNFTTTFSVHATAQQTFEAIKNVRGWWGQGIQGRTEQIGDEFTYRHKDIHLSRQELVEQIPGRRIVWVVRDADLSFTTAPDEWKGTQLVFDLTSQGGDTEVRFTHVGLVRAFECFDACSKGWTFYVGDSLRRLITTGRGRPDSKEDGREPVAARV